MYSLCAKVYGRQGHRQRQSFGDSFTVKPDVDVAITVLREDITNTHDYVIIMIAAAEKERCFQELEAQLTDGIFECSKVGSVEIINTYES